MEPGKMILCDTDVLIEYYKGNYEVVYQLEQAGKTNLCLSTISCGELFYGANNKQELQNLRESIEQLHILGMDNFIST